MTRSEPDSYAATNVTAFLDRPPASPLEADLRGVLHDWAASGAFADQTLDRMGEYALRFVTRVSRAGRNDFGEVGEADVAAFVWARTRRGDEPSEHTMQFRRTTVRAVYRSLRRLGRAAGDPTLDLVLPPRTRAATRPLTDEEVALLRLTALTRTHPARAGTVLALAEAGAITSEIPNVRLADLDERRQPTTVRLPGCRSVDARTAPLTHWERRVVARRAAELAAAAPATPLTYRARRPQSRLGPQAATCNQLGELLALAGLAAEPDIRIASVRAWAARRSYDAGTPIEVLARQFGLRSLDATAALIALDWHPTTGEHR